MMMKLVRKASLQQYNSQRTFANVGTLPRVPLPALADTLARFETWCAPLLTDEELAETQQVIAVFGKTGGAGEKLHQALVEYDQQPEVYSWLDGFWPARYLGRRIPVSINANFVLLFKDTDKNQIERAAELVAAAVDYKLRLDTETLPAPVFRGQPLCAVQNKYLFSTTRIPGKVHDSVKVPYSDEHPGPSNAKHILVFHKGQAFRLNVIHAAGHACTLDTIKKALEDLVQSAANTVATDSAVGYLTTLARADWADVRAELMADVQNKHTIDEIEAALFCLCLDDVTADSKHTATDALLQGDGGNRWFDKSVSLIVLKDGYAGINCEHCGLDGSTVVCFVDELHAEETLQRIALANQHASTETTAFSALEFSLTDSVKGHIRRAQQDFQALVDNTATHYFCFEDFGTAQIKCLKISPDAFVQLAFQLAHYRSKGLIGATYESVATRHFERGRTEAMRVVTDETIQFVKTLQNANSSDDAKRAALRKAANAHSNRLRACQQGKAPEQHLWQLLLIAEAQGDELGIRQNDLALFSSPGWLTMRNDYLSTSSAPSDSITVFGFGATSEQCIGIAYLPRAEGIYAYLSTPSSVAGQMQEFTRHLNQVLRELANLLAGENA